MLGCDSDPIRKLNPGNARLINAPATVPAAAATPVAVVVVVAGVAAAGADVGCVLGAEPWSGLNPRLWVCRVERNAKGKLVFGSNHPDGRPNAARLMRVIPLLQVGFEV